MPKRGRWHLRHKPEVISGLLTVFLRAVETTIRQRSPGAPPDARFGAVAFVYRFGSYLNSHVHFHVLVTDGVFSAGPDGEAIFHPALDLERKDFEAVQAKLRHRGLRWLHRHGFERLARYCARRPAAGRRCWCGSTNASRSGARSAASRCASSPSCWTSRRSSASSSTSANPRSRPWCCRRDRRRSSRSGSTRRPRPRTGRRWTRRRGNRRTAGSDPLTGRRARAVGSAVRRMGTCVRGASRRALCASEKRARRGMGAGRLTIGASKRDTQPVSGGCLGAAALGMVD
ncbi:MAG: transposase [bacterium]|nr:transposase [bacterium]